MRQDRCDLLRIFALQASCKFRFGSALQQQVESRSSRAASTKFMKNLWKEIQDERVQFTRRWEPFPVNLPSLLP